MIWVAGEIVQDLALKVSVLDRTFEHGLGLFETFRTWNGRASTLPGQLRRLAHSAQTLGLPVPAAAELPDQADIDRLRQAEGLENDTLLRLTMSAGSDRTPPVVWLQARPLPPAVRTGGALVRASWSVEPTDPLLSHKTLNYWRRRLVYEAALRAGFDEDLALCGNSPSVTEGTRTNLFIVQHQSLQTPSDSGWLLPGVMRETVLRLAPALGFDLVSSTQPAIPVEAILSADEVFLTNSVRGIVPVGSFSSSDGKIRKYPAPGPWTTKLWQHLQHQLQEGEIP